MSESEAKANFWVELVIKVIPGLILGIALAYANHQFWHKQEEYKKLSERIDQRINLYTELSHELFKFIDSHNAVSPYYRLSSCDARCLKEKAPLDESKQAIASNISKLLFRAEVYFPGSMEQIGNVKKLGLSSYQAPNIQVTSKHEMYIVFRESLAHLGDVVKKDIGILPNK